MSKSKSQLIADQLNAVLVDRHPSEYRAAAKSIAQNIGVGLYWLDTASDRTGRQPKAEVWQITRQKWTRELGSIQLGYDGVWRA